METVSILQDLFDHNDWANARILSLCEMLTNAQLDAPREMGFGSLRNTVFHVLEAEKIWLERWLGLPVRPFQADADGLTIEAIKKQAKSVAEQRNALIEQEVTTGFQRVVSFQDSREHQWRFPIGALMHHVANHGIHHRAQALSFLRSFDLMVPAGLDYLFWKVARPSCELPVESVEPLRSYGLEVATAAGKTPKFDRPRIVDFFSYNDWANQQILDASGKLDDLQLDQPFEMGMGSIRKNLQHMLDAERWWLANWAKDKSPFPHGEKSRSLDALRDLTSEVATRRNEFVRTLDEAGANRIVHVTAGGPDTCFRVTESLIQLCGHGTHHRAQCVNMLRQFGVELPWIDFVVWLREK